MKAMINEVVIHGIKYKAVDMPLEDSKNTCANCDIYLACVPQTMAQIPLCCHYKYQDVNISCGRQFEKGIHRIWKRV